MRLGAAPSGCRTQVSRDVVVAAGEPAGAEPCRAVWRLVRNKVQRRSSCQSFSTLVAILAVPEWNRTAHSGRVLTRTRSHHHPAIRRSQSRLGRCCRLSRGDAACLGPLLEIAAPPRHHLSSPRLTLGDRRIRGSASGPLGPASSSMLPPSHGRYNPHAGPELVKFPLTVRDGLSGQRDQDTRPRAIRSGEPGLGA